MPILTIAHSSFDNPKGILAVGVKTLRKDPATWLVAIVLALVVLPYVVPLLTEDQMQRLSYHYADLMLDVAAIVALTAGLRRVTSKREQRFWRMCLFALFAMLAADATTALLPTVWNADATTVLSQGLFLSFYAFLALAIGASRIDVETEITQELRWRRTIGFATLLGALLVYFAVIPISLSSGDTDTWPVMLAIYVCLDLSLLSGFLVARSRTPDRRWRSILGWMAAAVGGFAVVDLLEFGLYSQLYVMRDFPQILDLAWYTPIAILMIGGRIHIATPPTEPESDVPTRIGSVSGGLLIGYTIALPALHLGLSGLGLVDPQLGDLRGFVALIAMAVIGTQAFNYHRKVELLHRSTNRDLKTSHERYSAFVSRSEEGIWRTELREPLDINLGEEDQIRHIYEHAYVAEVNDAMARMYRYSAGAEIEGRSLRELHGQHNSPGDRDSLRKLIRSGYKIYRRQTEEVDRLGNRKFFESSVIGIVEGGLLHRIWGTQLDVTLQREADRERELLEGRLRQVQKMETIGTMAGGIAHDFNNMLAPILGFTELAQEEADTQDGLMCGYLDHISTAATRAQEMVRQILTVSRRGETEREPVLLQDILDESLEFLRTALPNGIAIESRIDADAPPLMADGGQIHQVVMNIVSNAGQAIADGIGRIDVNLRTRTLLDGDVIGLPGGLYLELVLADDGPGMGREVAEKAFEPFFTTKGVGKGSGLGLSVAHGIVAEHAGQIQLDTAPGEGTRFTIYLPADETLVISASPAPAPPSRIFEGRALLVDDEAQVAEIGTAMLRKLGYEVTTFTDGREALEALEEDPDCFDVLVSDHSMPVMTGPQLAQAARGLNPQIAVVIASGYRLAEDPDMVHEFEQLGKPYSKSELHESILRAVGQA